MPRPLTDGNLATHLKHRVRRHHRRLYCPVGTKVTFTGKTSPSGKSRLRLKDQRSKRPRAVAVDYRLETRCPQDDQRFLCSFAAGRHSLESRLIRRLAVCRRLRLNQECSRSNVPLPPTPATKFLQNLFDYTNPYHVT